MGIPILEVEGYEADDVIATLNRRFSQKGFHVKIYTPDKDMLQLVGNGTRVINPITWEIFDSEAVRKKFGVPPHRVADFLTLVGDKIDNVPGIKGVGPKTAVKIIDKYGGIENILSEFENFKEEFPQADKETLENSYKLIKLIEDIDIDIKEEDLRLKPPKLRELKEVLRELEIKSILRDIDKTLVRTSQGTLF
jgi:DNA polymerase-1